MISRRADFEKTVERDVALGTITAIRSFRFDTLGRLIPISEAGPGDHRKIWTPGENVSMCGITGRTSEELHRPGGRLDMRDCTCGFYAYHSAGSDEVRSYGEYVIGVVSTWGLVTVGSKGLRASRARVDALVLPDAVTTPAARKRELPTVPGLAVWMLVAAVAVLFAGIGLRSGAFWSWLMLGMTVTNAFLWRKEISGIGRPRVKARSHDLPDKETQLRIARNYPDAKVYSTIAEMLEHHPLSYGALPYQALTPDNPEFWTVEA